MRIEELAICLEEILPDYGLQPLSTLDYRALARDIYDSVDVISGAVFDHLGGRSEHVDYKSKYERIVKDFSEMEVKLGVAANRIARSLNVDANQVSISSHGITITPR